MASAEYMREYMRKYRETHKVQRKRKPMTDEQRQRHAEYQREWRKDNPERVKAIREAYILRKAERIKASQDSSQGNSQQDGGGNDGGN